jgi:hypothetical protein
MIQRRKTKEHGRVKIHFEIHNARKADAGGS